MSFPRDSRKAANARDAARHTWVVKGDGDNRHTLRKAVAAIVNRKERLARYALMTHRADIAYLMQVKP